MGARIALVLGIDDYSPASGLTKLESAENDAKGVAHFLQSCAFDHVDLRLGAALTSKGLKTGVPGQKRESPSIFLVYFAGRGALVDNRLCLYGSDFVAGQGETAIDLQELTRTIVEHVHPDQLVLLIDASREIHRATSSSRWDPYRLDLNKLTKGSKTQVLALFGCSSNQLCWEMARIVPSGLFTHALLEILRSDVHGASLRSLADEISARTATLAGAIPTTQTQTPVCFRSGGDAAFELNPVPSRPASPIGSTPLATSHGQPETSGKWRIAAVASIVAALLFGIWNWSIPDHAESPSRAIESRDTATVPVKAPSQPELLPETARVNTPDKSPSLSFRSETPLERRDAAPSVEPSTTPLALDHTSKPEGGRAVSPTRSFGLPDPVDVAAATELPDPGPARYGLVVYTDKLIERGSQLRLDDPALRELGCLVHYEGPKPPRYEEIVVEWTIDGARWSRRQFGRNDTSFLQRSKYENRVTPGKYVVVLKVDSDVVEKFDFEIYPPGRGR